MDILKKKMETKYLNFDFTDKNKEALRKCAKLWNKIKNEIETINGEKKIEYAKDFIKIKFDSDDNLPLNKPLKFPTMTIIIKYVFQKYSKLYSWICLDECLYKL